MFGFAPEVRQLRGGLVRIVELQEECDIEIHTDLALRATWRCLATFVVQYALIRNWEAPQLNPHPGVAAQENLPQRIGPC